MEDFNPKAFLRKHLDENDDLRQLRGSLDFKKEINTLADALHSHILLSASPLPPPMQLDPDADDYASTPANRKILVADKKPPYNYVDAT
ncbi:hypothetical protein ACFQ71_39400 [Streptomyces sp. NPDC056534]|uniref:hypothetical protein n=1 Tax=Streptomyces sp. NPDC056534 TaxID=3345857 RepID=UPI00367C29A2